MVLRRSALAALVGLFLIACGADTGQNDAGVTCPPDETLCNGSCVQPALDVNNCGSCGTTCPAGLLCVGGTCGCPPGLTTCNATCINTAADNGNCGSCGAKCTVGQVCSAGACATSCAPNLTDCGGGCVNLQTDLMNCGQCGTTCPMGQVCAAGSCKASCGSNLTACGGTCVDTSSDPSNCGGCASADITDGGAPHVCVATAGFHDVAVCNHGTCAWVCQAHFGDCDNAPSMVKGSEESCPSSFATDACNCGGCGQVCPGNPACFGPFALPPHAQVCCSEHCTDLTSPSTCGTSCGNAKACGVANPDCCGGSCTNSQSDRMNCASCGNACMGAQPECCAAACTDGTADPMNCGSCGMVCPKPTASSVPGCCPGAGPNPTGHCVDFTTAQTCGNCNTQCTGGQPDCCNQGCTNKSGGDLNNCGACGTVCPSPTSGQQIACCPANAGQPTRCVDVKSALRDCGTCGNDCTPQCVAGAIPVCISGTCQCILP